LQSIFTDKNKPPIDKDLKEALGDTYQLWQSIKDYVFSKYPKAMEEWSCSKYGWRFRIKDKKRAILYFLPRDQFFKLAFVFGQKATDQILNSQISNAIKTELNADKVYAEGRRIRIDIINKNNNKDIQELIDIKLAN
jgi:hypothetical protein